MISQEANLVGLYRAELERVARLRNSILGIQGLILALTCIAAFVDANRAAVYTITVLACGGTIAWALTGRAQTIARNNAECARRAAILVWGLGEPLPLQEYSDILSRFRGRKKDAEQLADPKFFSTTRLTWPEKAY